MNKNIKHVISKIRQYVSRKAGNQTGRLFLFSICAATLFPCLIILIGYGVESVLSDRTSREIRTIYDSAVPEETKLPDVTVLQTAVPETVNAGVLTEDSQAASGAEALELPTPDPDPAPEPELVSQCLLPEQGYPDNPEKTVNSSFRSVRKENKDIIGWLTVDRQMDEAVVQRDHVYYLDHDVMLNRNVNGAILLDAAVRLDEGRPYALILYGHNMKTGRMFGWLRNYENTNFYHNNPWVRFNTVYEDGKYVVFAAGIISTAPGSEKYVDLFAMTSRRREDLQKAIGTLIDVSVHTCTIDVDPSDQILVLVTCVDADDERRVVAARRIRDGESEEDLQQLVKRSRNRNVRHR